MCVVSPLEMYIARSHTKCNHDSRLQYRVSLYYLKSTPIILLISAVYHEVRGFSQEDIPQTRKLIFVPKKLA